MAVGQGGYSTNGMLIATAGQVFPNALVPGDTEATAGGTPQTLAFPLGLLGTAIALGVLAATAFAGGGQASATLLAYGINTVTVVATAADSVKLPPAIAGRWLFIRNVAANATTVYGSGTDTINGVATATGVSQAATSGVLYFATAGVGDGAAGTWVRT